VEFHEITVEAVDQDFEDVLDAVEKKTIRIRVERMPLTVEGAINRSRPPYVMRFVFLLRDTLGRAIPTRTQEDLDRIRFTVTDEGIPLDLDETSLYITGPDNLRVNLMLMLDYTGSMYFAGTRDAVNPLAPGEAVAQVKAAARHFLDDLPPGYRVGLMYYNDRQQPNRLIHALTTDREALKDALDRFTIPAAQFGVSTIYDALNDAIARLAAEDAEDVLPFDDADIRAIVFITDGQDNASVADADNVKGAATDARVRLYPVGYSAGGPVNNKDMLVLASETGGHLFTAGNVRNLTRLLGNEKGLSLESADGGLNTVRFRVVNVGETTLLWNAVVEDGSPWITNLSPVSGAVAPGGATLVTAQVNSAMVSPNQAVLGIIHIASDNGEGVASIRMEVGADNALPEALTLELWDEPGRIWAELQHQLVLTYVTPRQTGGRYSIRVEYTQPDGTDITGFFEEDGVFYPGDVLAGQIALRTSGIQQVLGETDPDEAVRAEVYVRTDYVPRDVTRFRMRFFLSAPDDAPAAALSALAAAQMWVELAPDGLLITDDPFQPTWRLLEEGDGIYNLLTAQDNPLPYASFGNLLKITVTGLGGYVAAFAGTGRDPELFVEMRMDNAIYVSPATPSQPSRTKYFLYPGGPTNPDRLLSVSLTPDAAPPARSAFDLAFPGIDPEALFAWDRDEDGLPDFYDPYPDRADLPGRLVTPNPFEIGAAQSVGVLTIRNNRLDTFSWGIETASLPAWISAISYGDGTASEPQSVLTPGERERIYLHVDRTGLPGGFVRGTVRVNTDLFADEEIQVTVLVSAP
ncbi:MAG TPA: VWA domain-containing protein, partial [Candidatus Hydrogenedentes bacterium]|nr:VWA domain-containing protein [Candidatus Hydrogenedentota bacterium]